MTQSAQELVEAVEDLRSNIEAAYTNRKWANDNQFAQSYRQLAIVAVGEFPGDPIIGLLQTTIPQEFDLLMGRDPSCVTSWVRMQVGRLAIRLSQLS